MQTFDVVVVGGGPVGLWTACELRLAGLDVVVLERRVKAVVQSRSLTIHGRSLEMFALRGLAERFLGEGMPIPIGHYGMLDTRLSYAPFDTRFPYMLWFPQFRTEAVLLNHARELGVVILHGHTVDSVQGNASDGYVVSAELEHGAALFSARAVVGADARRSIVRQTAEILFEGHDSTLSVMTGDLHMDPLEGGESILLTVTERGAAMVLPIETTDLRRVIIFDPQRLNVPASEPLTLEELSESATRVIGVDYRLRDPYYLDRWGDETRLASAYRRGNLFIAGDAAHIHTPAGGQGMSVGLQDAMNLGWKLAAVLKGEAPDALLDTYEAERRPVGARLAGATLAQMALLTKFDPAHLSLRTQLSQMLEIPELNRKLAGALSGFGTTYPASEMFKEGPGVGERVPDHAVIFADGVPAGIHSCLNDGKWLHLSFKEGARMELPDWLSPSAVRFVQCQLAKPIAGQADPAAMLVRPDGYCAGRIDSST
jgi:2-polyprenyl-6-methoxyphenol hydroxylase-like FAD-dependent oxidoreductase